MSSVSESVVDNGKRKLTHLQKDPVQVLKRRLRATAEEMFGRYPPVRFKWPLYDISRWLANSTARKLYKAERSRMILNEVQARIVDELKKYGISIIHFNELFPLQRFSELQELAEGYLSQPKNNEKINAIRGGLRPGKAGKFYLVRLLGDEPVLDRQSPFVALSLSHEILSVVCGYLGMFSRVVDMDLWCNVPTEGPDTYSQAWHRDPDDKKLVKTFLYLQDVAENTGPFCYIPGSHNGGPFGRVFPQRFDTSRYPAAGAVADKFTSEQIKVCTGKAGTFVFCDTTGLHKGGHPQDGLRLLYTTGYMSQPGVAFNGRRYSLSHLRPENLSPAGRFAIGHLGG